MSARIPRPFLAKNRAFPEPCSQYLPTDSAEEAVHLISPPVFDRHARAARADHPGRDILGHNRAGGDDGLRPDCDTRADEDLGANPCAVLDCDGAIVVGHVVLGEIVVAGAKERSLGDAAVASDDDGFEIENEDLFPNPREITDPQFPREMDVDAGFDTDAPADLRSKGAQQRAFERRGPWNRTQEKHTLQRVP